MPKPRSRASILLASAGLAVLALGSPGIAAAARATGPNQPDKNVVLSADSVSKDDINNTISANGHVELVQGASMVLAEHIVWNQTTDVVIATGEVKLVDDQGNIYFGDYLEITDDMRQAFIRNVSGLLADNSRLVGRQAEKDGSVMVINRGVYSACEPCKDDPTRPPTWQIKAVKVIRDSDEKRIYYHDATFELGGIPVAWTPYFSTYDPTVKRADGILYSEFGYRAQLGGYDLTAYYFDLAPDKDLEVTGGYYTEQGPYMGAIYRERFDAGQIQISGSITESNIRQYPENQLNPDDKGVRASIFAQGEFDLSENWRAGFDYQRTTEDIYILKYQLSSQQVLTSNAYLEGFFDRDYINASLYSFQDLRAFTNLSSNQPHALPYITYSFFGDPGETLGGRWADSGSILDLQRFPGIVPGQSVERIANNASWARKLISDWGLVTDVNASVETDYYLTQNAQQDPITGLKTVKPAAGRIFPQANIVMSYPLERPIGYANLIVEPIVSLVAAPSYANNRGIPNEDSTDIQLNALDLFSNNRFPGFDRIEGGSRVTYGVRAGLYNLGTGYSSVFLGESYRISGNNAYPPNSGLTTRFSDLVGQVEIVPGRLIDIDYDFELSNDLKTSRVQEINFKIGPDNYGVNGTYLFNSKINVFNGQFNTSNFVTNGTNEVSLGAYYKFSDHWSVTGYETAELIQPRTVLRYGISGGYSDDCSSFSLYLSRNNTINNGGTSGTVVSIVFSLKDLGIFKSPSVH